MGKAKLAEVEVGVNFGIFELKTKWTEDPKQRDAAWALSVELLTRVATQPIGDKDGLIRDALGSLRDLFPIFREVLRAAGPAVGVRRDTIGGTALVVVNKVLRPFLAEWHPRLLEWEATRAENVSVPAHERAWAEAMRCRGALMRVQEGLRKYAESLAQFAGALPEGP